MSYETFRVVEANEQFGFARLKSESSEELLHAELYPDEGENKGPLQLRVGDHVSGLRRGQSVSRVSWVSKTPPPAELVQKMGELGRALAQHGFESAGSPEVLAERSWRKARDRGALEVELSHRLPAFFSEELHPLEDAQLLHRVSERTGEFVPQLSIQPLAGQAKLRVDPGGHEVPAPKSTREDPLPTFRPLVDRLNALLEVAGAKVRWVQVRGNWRLGVPDLVALVVRHGLVRGALLN
jgi:hypothetical protein